MNPTRRDVLKAAAALVGAGPLMPWTPPQYRPLLDAEGLGLELIEATSPPTYPYWAATGSGDEYGNILYLIAKEGGPIGVGREVLTADRTYYVRTDGSDSNDGLTNDAAGAFATIPHALTTVSNLDIQAYNVDIQIGDGTYTDSLLITGQWIGSGIVTLKGNPTTPANVHLNLGAGTYGVEVRGGRLTIQDLKLSHTGNYALAATAKGSIEFSNLDFGACGVHLRAEKYGTILCIGNYAISGGANSHMNATNGEIRVAGFTVAISNTPTFASAFAYAQLSGTLITFACTYTGTGANGPRYSINSNAQCFTNGGGASYFPGSTAGSVSLGGLYI